MKNKINEEIIIDNDFNYDGYQVVRGEFFAHLNEYLIGKLYEVRKNIGADIGITTKVIQKFFADEYKKDISTIVKYALFSRTIDKLSNTNTDYIIDVLAEKIPMPYTNTYKLISEANKYGRKSAKIKIEDKSC